MAEQVSQKAQRQQPGFEQMAKSIHGSYLRRWVRHDPRAAEAALPDADTSKRPDTRRTSAA